MIDKTTLHILTDSLLTRSGTELEECRTHIGEYAKDSWLACMITARVLGQLAGVLIDLRQQLEKADAAREKARSQFQFPTPISIRGGLQARDETALCDGERSNPSPARDQLDASRDEGTEQD